MQSLVRFTYFMLFVLATNVAMAQQQSIIVVNGGIFGAGSTDYANLSIEDLTTNTFSHIDTIYKNSIQDILIDGQYAYVAAQDSIVKYDWTTKTRIAADKFVGGSTIKIAKYNNYLLVGNWYAPWGAPSPYNYHFTFYDANTLALVDSVPAVTMPAKDFVVVGDYAYITQNNGTGAPNYADTLGYLAVVDLTTKTLVRYDTLSTTGHEIGRVIAEGNMVYALNGVSNTISSLNTTTLAKSTQATTVDLQPRGYGPTAFTKGSGVWYFPYDNGIGSYNLSTNAVVTANIAPAGPFVMDTINDRFCVSFINFSDQTQNAGKIYDMNGDSVGTFQVGFSPEALAIVSNVVGSTVKIANGNQLNYEIFPNPTADLLTVELEKAEAVQLYVINQVGQNVLTANTADATTTLNVEGLASGIYFLAVVSEEGVMRTTRFVKK